MNQVIELDVERALTLAQRSIAVRTRLRRFSLGGAAAVIVAAMAFAVTSASRTDETVGTTASSVPLETATPSSLSLPLEAAAVIRDIEIVGDPISVVIGDTQTVTIRLRNNGTQPLELGAVTTVFETIISDAAGTYLGGSAAGGSLPGPATDPPDLMPGEERTVRIKLSSAALGGPAGKALEPGDYLLWVQLGLRGSEDTVRVAGPVPIAITSQ